MDLNFPLQQNALSKAAVGKIPPRIQPVLQHSWEVKQKGNWLLKPRWLPSGVRSLPQLVSNQMSGLCWHSCGVRGAGTEVLYFILRS